MEVKKVFIDGGAHRGEAIDVLLDKRKDLLGCDIHFFEPNGELIVLLEDLAINNANYNITVYHSALWIDNNGVNFLKSIGRWNTLASTIIPSMNEIWGLKLDRDNPQKVPSTNLSEFLDTFDDDDYIILKLDVEGSEYELIKDLIKTNKINKIKELYIEWHDHFFPHFKKLGNELRIALSKLNIIVKNDWM